MKILHVIDTLMIGGAERVMVDLSNILHENGEDVSALFLLEKGPLSCELNPQIKQYELFRYKRFSVKCICRFIRIAKHYDIIHVHMRHCFEYVSFVSLLHPSLKKKVVFHDHYGDINIDDKCPVILKASLRHHLAVYIGVSEQLVDWAKRNGTSNCFLLPNIVRKQVTEVPSSSNVVGFVSVGNIRQTKNYEYLAELARQFPNENFTIYGNINSPDYWDKIRKMIGNNVNVVKGVSRVQPLLRNYRLAIHCAPSETGPLVLIEYLAQGIPFVVYRTGEVVRQIQDDLPELIVDNFEIQNWLDRIGFIEQHYEEIQEKMSTVYEKYYSEQTYYNKCKTIYQNVQDC